MPKPTKQNSEPEPESAPCFVGPNNPKGLERWKSFAHKQMLKDHLNTRTDLSNCKFCDAVNYEVYIEWYLNSEEAYNDKDLTIQYAIARKIKILRDIKGDNPYNGDELNNLLRLTAKLAEMYDGYCSTACLRMANEQIWKKTRPKNKM